MSPGPAPCGDHVECSACINRLDCLCPHCGRPLRLPDRETSTLEAKAAAFDSCNRARAAAEEHVDQLQAEIGALKRQLDAEEKGAERNSGLLADLADILFGRNDRALLKGYEGLIERARELVRGAQVADPGSKHRTRKGGSR